MDPREILYPMAALAVLTFIVLLLIPYARFKAGRRRQVTMKDFKYGESADVPAHVSIPNRNLMNLLEMPVLFYVACLTLFVTRSADHIFVYLAWAYFALRGAHSLVHLTYNNVIHRLSMYAASNVVLVIIWVRLIAMLSR
jgi:hypothetical protein